MTPWAYMSRVAEPAQKYHPVAILNQKPPRPKKLPPGSPKRGLSRNGVKNYSKGSCVTILE